MRLDNAVINEKEFTIKIGAYTFYALELKTPNKSTTSDILGFFVEDEATDTLEMFDYIYGVSLMGDAMVMADLMHAVSSWKAPK